MQLTSHNVTAHIGRLARLGRQRDFSLARFEKALSAVANGDRADILRQLLTDWTGLPFETEDAAQRWGEIEELLPKLRERLGAPLGLQTVLLHHFHSREGTPEGASPRFGVRSRGAPRERDHGSADRALQPSLPGRSHLARDRARRALRGHRLDGDDGPARLQVDQRPAGASRGGQRPRADRARHPRIAARDRRGRPLGRRRVRARPSRHRHGLRPRRHRAGAQPDRHASAGEPRRADARPPLRGRLLPARRPQPGLPPEDRGPASLPVPLAVDLRGGRAPPPSALCAGGHEPAHGLGADRAAPSPRRSMDISYGGIAFRVREEASAGPSAGRPRSCRSTTPSGTRFACAP